MLSVRNKMEGNKLCFGHQVRALIGIYNADTTQTKWSSIDAGWNARIG